MGLGFFQSFFAPCAVALIVDYFPVYKRTGALAIYSMGISVAAALSSLTTIMIESLGWRSVWEIIGILFMIIGGLIVLSVKEPARS
jgi:MFS family permease